MTTEDIARFGQLYLQKGEWGGRRLLPAEWVAAATTRQASNGSNPASDWDQGYGYQFWRCRHGLYRGDGAFGQYGIVMPEHDAVVAITSGVRNMQAVLNLVWEHVLPGMKAAPLPADRPVHGRLEKKLASLWFTGRALVFDQEMNVAFGPTKRPQLVGRPSGEPRAAPASAKR